MKPKLREDDLTMSETRVPPMDPPGCGPCSCGANRTPGQPHKTGCINPAAAPLPGSEWRRPNPAGGYFHVQVVRVENGWVTYEGDDAASQSAASWPGVYEEAPANTGGTAGASDVDALFAAFVAGFEASGEGFNGEWVNAKYRGDGKLEDHLRRWHFRAWREGREVDYRAMIDFERASKED